MYEKEAQAQFERAYPESLRSHSISNKLMGGEMLFEEMNFVEKALVKKMAGIHESVSKIDQNKIEELISEIKNTKY